MMAIPLGQFLAVLSAICFAASSVFIAKGAKGGGDRGVIFSALVTLVFALVLWLVIDGGQLPAENNLELWWGLFWFAMAGLLSVVIGRTLVYASIRKLGVTRSSAVKKATPFFSVLFALIILEELLGLWNWVGVATMAFAFILLSWKSFQKLSAAERAITPDAIDYTWGLGGAVVYALSYICRKLGLEFIASPAFGTMISALIGFFSFVVLAFFSTRYRDHFRNLFRNLNIWLVLAAIAISSGQILIFAALFHEAVAVVIMINSLEIFFASFMAVVIFRTEKRPDLMTAIAAMVAFFAVVLIVL